MIRYALKCPEGHDFESWFQSSAAYDSLHGAGRIACPICGSPEVRKAVMAPRLKTGHAQEEAAQARGVAPTKAGAHPLSAPENPKEAAIRAALERMRAQVEANSDYVGMEFAREARAMHLGDTPERAIHGEARLEDAKALLEEGIPVAPLPFDPRRKPN